VKVISFNIRYASAKDGENAWPFRRGRVAKLLSGHGPDFFGLQEAQQVQMDDLGGDLPEYSFIGVGREDGRLRGEYSAIFFRKSQFHCLRQGTFWLSETPEVAGSRGWDARVPRICTWGEFLERGRSGTFFLFNTHLDNRGERAKLEGARLIISKVREISGGRPSVIMGDFNTPPDSDPYKVICQSGGAVSFRDARAISTTPPSGPPWTMHAFKIRGHKRIDYIFVDDSIQVELLAHLEDLRTGEFASDHLAVMAQLRLPDALGSFRHSPKPAFL
jgi:endonuclease/exonuclease/phosphatase family metal-dependent hydrolase